MRSDGLNGYERKYLVDALRDLKSLLDLSCPTKVKSRAPWLVFSYQAWIGEEISQSMSKRPELEEHVREILPKIVDLGCKFELKYAFGSLDYVGRLSAPSSALRPGPDLADVLRQEITRRGSKPKKWGEKSPELPPDAHIKSEIGAQAFVAMFHMIVTRWIAVALKAREVVTHINIKERPPTGASTAARAEASREAPGADQPILSPPPPQR